jgi:hypothetical protein
MKLNDDKTEFLIIGTKQQLLKTKKDEITIGMSRIESNLIVRNLGVLFDCEMSLNKRINDMCRRGYIHIRPSRIDCVFMVTRLTRIWTRRLWEFLQNC